MLWNFALYFYEDSNVSSEEPDHPRVRNCTKKKRENRRNKKKEKNKIEA
jgi:hypothetical protein